MTTQKEALKLALDEIKRVKEICLREVGIGLCNEIVIAKLEEALAQTEQEPVTVLPDGSAFAVMSYPLPKDHWLYAERQYEGDADEPNELGKPILTHALRDAVVSAVRYAIRGATNCGKELDFDPDALVQNAVYALCGPYGLAESKKPEQEPVAVMELYKSGWDLVEDIDTDWLETLPFGTRLYTHPPVPTAQPKEPEQNLKLMPRKATPEMLRAMDECSMEGYDERLYEGHASSVYMAAWDAFYGQHCYCGDITNLGVIHRDDGPCHYPEQPKVRTGDCLLTGVCASEGHRIAPQRKPLTYVDLRRIANQCGLGASEVSAQAQAKVDNFARAIEAAHGIKE